MGVSFVGPENYTPGTTVEGAYTLTISNPDDTDAADDVAVSTAFPADVTVDEWTCTASTGGDCKGPSGSGNLDLSNVSIAADGSVEYVFDVSFAASLSDDPLKVTAQADDVSGTAESILARKTKLSVTKETVPAGETKYVPGANGTFLITVSNAGPSDAVGVGLTDTVPAGMTVDSWSCTPTDDCPVDSDSGNGELDEIIAVAAGGSLAYTVNVSYDSSLVADLTNTVRLTVPADLKDSSNPENHSDSVTLTPEIKVNLQTNIVTPISAVAGESTLITFTVSNIGPSDAVGASVFTGFVSEFLNDGDIIAAEGVTILNWNCTPAELCEPSLGIDPVNSLIDLAADPDQVVTFHLTAEFSSDLLDGVDVVAGAILEGEQDIETAEATAPVALTRKADVKVVKTLRGERATVNPGEIIVYDIVVSNLGPSDIGHGDGETGIELTDILPNSLRADVNECGGSSEDPPCWNYCPSDNGIVGDYTGEPAVCPVETVLGSGNIQNQAFRLRAGSTSLVRVFAVVLGSASGTITNTASIELGDEGVAANSDGGKTDSSTWEASVEQSTDLVVVKTDGLTQAVPGQDHSYTITVTNAGFVSANNVRVKDEIPLFPVFDAGFVPDSITWQCRAFDGACCNTNSSSCGVSSPITLVSGDWLDHGVDLPGQARVEITATGRIDPRATGTLSNTASAELPDGIVEQNPVSATDTDDDTLLVPEAQLTLTKSVESVSSVNDDDQPPFTLVYRLQIGNSGPSVASDVNVSDPLGDINLVSSTASWTCEVINGSDSSCSEPAGSGGVLSTKVDIEPGGLIEIELTVDTEDVVEGQVTNTASLQSAAGSAQASVTTSLIGQAELTITKTDNRDTAAPGTTIDYVITVHNEGPNDVFGARLTDEFPPELADVSWMCEASTPVPGDLAAQEVVGTARGAGRAIVASGDGRHVYVAGSGFDDLGRLFVFERDNVPGLTFGRVVPLETEIQGVADSSDTGGVVTGLEWPVDVVMNPGGQHVYVLSQPTGDNGNPAIAIFSRDINPGSPSFGKVTFADRVTEGLPAHARRLAVTNGNLYVTGDNEIAIFRREAGSGMVSFDRAHTNQVPPAPGPIALDIGRQMLFVAATSGGTVASFKIQPAGGGDPAGRLAPVATLSQTAFDGAEDLIAVPDGEHLYLSASGAGRLAVIDYNDESLSSEVSYGGGTDDLSAALTAGARIGAATDGEHLFGVSPGQNYLVQFRRDPASGGLSLEDEFSGQRGLQEAAAVLVTSDGRHVLVASASTAEDSTPLAVYSRRAPEPLFAFIQRDRQGDNGGQLQGLTAPNDIAVSPDGEHVYTVSLPDHALTVFKRSPDKGVTDETLGEHLDYQASYFNGQGGFQGLHEARRILISPDGRHVFVTSRDKGTLAVFARDHDSESAGFGSLAPVAGQVFTNDQNGVQGLAGALGMAMDSNGRHLYVAGRFGASIAIFERSLDAQTFGELTFVGRVQNTVDGVSGLNGIRDLAVSPDNAQLLGVGFGDTPALVVFDRASTGSLSFVQAISSGIGTNPMALAIPAGSAAGAGEHVYVASHSSNSISVLRRVTDPSSSAFGQVQPLSTLINNQGGITNMLGPRDVRVSPDGKRVYVAAENSSALLMFDRDLNASGGTFGRLSLVETRRDNVDGVDGLAQVRALAVSGDSRNVYAAAFGDRAVSSFRLGIGSVCSAGGSGNIDDLVDIGVNGTLVYRASATIRPDAMGTISNTASISLPNTFQPVNPDSDCPVQVGASQAAEFCATDTTDLVPTGNVSVTKTSDVVSVIAGESVRYQVVIRNPGPSNLVNESGFPLSLTDDLDANPAFVANSATWTCQASGSGALNFVTTYDEGAGFDGLGGISDLALVPAASGGAGSPFELLAGASVLDDALVLFRRDPDDGALIDQWVITGPNLIGARAVTATSDGRHLYVASRIADSVSVFALDDDGSGGLQVSLVEVKQGLVGLDQAVHLALSPDQSNLYVAGANDNAIAVFGRHSATGELSFVEAVQHGQNGVNGLLDVNYLLVSPDGDHLYAVSPTTPSITVFERDQDSNGELSFLKRYTGGDLGVNLAGLSSVVIDSAGQFIYLSAGLANRIVVLARDSSGGNNHGELAFASTIVQTDDGVAGLAGVRRLALSADDIHLYATSQSGDSIAWFVRDAANGSLTFGGLRSNLAGSVDGLDGATGLVVDALTDQVYVAGTLQAAISQFQRQVDSFCPASGTGSLIDVPFNIAAGGTVTFVIDVDVEPGYTGELINEAVVTAARDENTGNHTSTVTNVVSVVADLAISKDDGLSEFDGLAGVSAVDGFGKHLYVAGSADNALGVYARRETISGPVFSQPPFVQVMRSGENGVTGLTGVLDVGVSADGAHVYAVSPTDNALVATRRDPATGRLEFLEIQQNGLLGVSGLSGANALALSPDDQHVYVTGGFANTIAVFSRNGDSGSSGFGRLTFRQIRQEGVDGVMGLAGARALTVSPDGRHVYALGGTADTVAAFVRNPSSGSANFGQLGFVAHYSNQNADTGGLTGVRDLVISPDGEFVYVLGAEDGTLVQFARDKGTGTLEFVEFLQDGFGATAGLNGARRLVFAADGQSLIVVGGAGGSLARYSIDPDDGRLAWAELISDGDEAVETGGQVFGLTGATDAWATPDGEQFFVTSAASDALIGFRSQAVSPTFQFVDIVIDGLGGVAPGESVTYLITVDNHGPSNVPVARVVDQFPESFSSVSWLCSTSGGAQCQTEGDGDLDLAVSLPAGSRITIEATGVVSSEATGRLINTATVSADNVVDPNPDNNSATDDDTVLSPAMDLVITVDDGATESTPGDWITYTVTGSNLGPSGIRGALIRDQLPAALYDVSWICEAAPAAGMLDLRDVKSGELDTITGLAFSGDGRVAYATGTSGTQAAVQVFSRDVIGGGLTPGQLLVQGQDGVTGIRGASDLALSGDGRFVYVSGPESDSVVIFGRDSDGQLTQLAQVQDGEFGIEGLGGAHQVLLGPDARQLYVASTADMAIAVFDINESTGLLTQAGVTRQGIDGVDGLNGVSAMAWSETGEYLLVTATANQSLAAFGRDSVSGLLEPVAVILNFELLGEDALVAPSALAVTERGLFVTDSASNRLSEFAFDPDEASMELVRIIEAASTPNLLAPSALLFDSDQARLYVAGADGMLLISLLPETPALIAEFRPADFAVIDGLRGMTFAPGRGQLYTHSTSPGAGIGRWARERGSRCPIAGTGALGRQAVDIVSGGQLIYEVRGRIRANASGELIYEVSLDNPLPEQELNPNDNVDEDINQLVPGPDLAIMKTADVAQVVAGEAIQYRLDSDNAGISDALAAELVDMVPVFPDEPAGITAGTGAWQCEANEPLALLADYPVPADLSRLVVGQAGHQVYAVSPTANALLLFPVDADGGLETPQVLADGDTLAGDTLSGLVGASAVAVSADERHIYVAGQQSNSLVVLTRETPGSGFKAAQKITSGQNGVAGLLGPVDVRLSADERFVLVASAGSDAIVVFGRDKSDGSLSFVERVRDGFGTIEPDFNVIKGVRNLLPGHSGGHLYAVSDQSESLSVFAVNPGSGVLTFDRVWRQGESGTVGLVRALDLATAPGDSHLYVLGEDGIAIFDR
ncbi:MAG: DUF11 domain-containing protein, partial [Wenzhouxiangella sp.]